MYPTRKTSGKKMHPTRNHVYPTKPFSWDTHWFSWDAYCKHPVFFQMHREMQLFYVRYNNFNKNMRLCNGLKRIECECIVHENLQTSHSFILSYPSVLYKKNRAFDFLLRNKHGVRVGTRRIALTKPDRIQALIDNGATKDEANKIAKLPLKGFGKCQKTKSKRCTLTYTKTVTVAHEETEQNHGNELVEEDMSSDEEDNTISMAKALEFSMSVYMNTTTHIGYHRMKGSIAKHTGFQLLDLSELPYHKYGEHITTPIIPAPKVIGLKSYPAKVCFILRRPSPEVTEWNVKLAYHKSKGYVVDFVVRDSGSNATIVVACSTVQHCDNLMLRFGLR